MDLNRNSQGGTKIILILLSLALIGGGILGFGYRKLSKQKTETQVIDERSQKTKVPIVLEQLQNTDTSNWETYHSEELMFEVKYPQDWASDIKKEVDERDREVGIKKKYIFSSDVLSFNIIVIDNTKFTEIFDFNKLLETNTGDILEMNHIIYSVQEHFRISGFNGINFYGDKERDFLIFPSIMGEAMLKKGETIFHFMLIVEQEALLEENKDIFKQILSTFRFTK